MIAACEAQGITIEHHCCLRLAFAISHPSEVEHQGQNRILDWIASWNEYRIPIAYDGYASTVMEYCPFCGKGLPESLNKRWYEQLYALGFSDPGDEEIPEEYESDAWWRN